MDLYVSPMACSLASHIIALEAEVPVKLHYVDLRTKRTESGEDYRAISPTGYVPALRLPDGTLLNEGPAVLQWLADQRPASGLAPAWGTLERYRLIDMLNYLSTEIHKKIFPGLLSARATAETKAASTLLLEPALEALARRLGDRETLVGDGFTVADAYLITMLNWFAYVGAPLEKWPTLVAYRERHMARPSVARAVSEERALYRKESEWRAAAQEA